MDLLLAEFPSQTNLKPIQIPLEFSKTKPEPKDPTTMFCYTAGVFKIILNFGLVEILGVHHGAKMATLE
jgi:hypothetical protein